MAGMATAFMRYCRLVFWAALPHSVSWANSIISIIIIIAGATILLVPSFGMTIDASGLVAMLRSPAFLAMLVCYVILFRLVCATYWVWREEHAARIKAESQVAELSTRHILSQNTDPNALSIDFLRDELHEIVQTLPGGSIRRRLKISVLNRGNGWLSNCRLSVEQTTLSIYNNAIEQLSGFTLQKLASGDILSFYILTKYSLMGVPRRGIVGSSTSRVCRNRLPADQSNHLYT